MRNPAWFVPATLISVLLLAGCSGSGGDSLGYIDTEGNLVLIDVDYYPQPVVSESARYVNSGNISSPFSADHPQTDRYVLILQDGVNQEVEYAIEQVTAVGQTASAEK